MHGRTIHSPKTRKPRRSATAAANSHRVAAAIVVALLLLLLTTLADADDARRLPAIVRRGCWLAGWLGRRAGDGLLPVPACL